MPDKSLRKTQIVNLNDFHTITNTCFERHFLKILTKSVGTLGRIFFNCLIFDIFFSNILRILSPNNYQNRHFFQFVHVDMIFNLFLCVPKIPFFISDNKILPSNNNIITFTRIYWMTSTLSHYRWIAKTSIFQGLIYFNPESETIFSFFISYLKRSIRMYVALFKICVAFICHQRP